VKLFGRDLGTVLGAAFESRHYIAAANMLRVYKHPAQLYARYLFGAGAYPAVVDVRTPTGWLSVNVYSHHDVLTVNEIFCRGDYRATEQDRVFVDFGSNIGISAAFFLTRGPEGFAYLFEPLPQNTARLTANLERFEGRYALAEVAVGTQAGQVDFGWEDSGRYGGVGQKTGRYISVKCLDSNRVLDEIIQRHGRIDVLKIDIETLEKAVTERIPPELARHIGRIYAETSFERNPFPATHTYRQYGPIATFLRRP